MPAQLKYVDPDQPRGALTRAYAKLANTRLGRFLSVQLLWKLDPLLIRATGGRLGLGFPLPTALLETRGAKSATLRRNAVIYFHDGERVTIIASKLGLPQNPAWFHNLQAEPKVSLGGTPMRAELVTEDSERERLWALADNVFAPYATYRREAAEAGRRIPIVQLYPLAS